MRYLSEVWSRLLGVQDLTSEHEQMFEVNLVSQWGLFDLLFTIIYYLYSIPQKLLEKAYQQSPWVRQIDLDVNRAMRSHEHYRFRFSPRQIELFKVLCAYSVYNSEIGFVFFWR